MSGGLNLGRIGPDFCNAARCESPWVLRNGSNNADSPDNCSPMIAIATAFLAAILPAAAQPWPNRPMTMVVPFAAGGASDVIARILAQGLRTELGQSVVVENVSGAGGMVGSSRVAKAAPDGYQMMLGNVGTHAQNQSLYKKPLYHAATDFAPVALVTDQSLVLVVRKDFPADSLQRSSPMPRRTRRNCSMARPAWAAPTTSLACCSTRRSALRSRIFPIAAAHRRCRT